MNVSGVFGMSQKYGLKLRHMPYGDTWNGVVETQIQEGWTEKSSWLQTEWPKFQQLENPGCANACQVNLIPCACVHMFAGKF